MAHIKTIAAVLLALSQGPTLAQAPGSASSPPAAKAAAAPGKADAPAKTSTAPEAAPAPVKSATPPAIPAPAVAAPPAAAPTPPRTLPQSASEQAYREKARALLAPLLTRKPGEGEITELKEALKARSLTAALALADPAAKKLALWQALKAGIGEPEDFQRFIAANPGWPDSQMLMRRAEEQLFGKGGTAPEIKSFFKGREPVSGAGWAALASAHLVEGDEAAARKHAQRAWADEEMSAAFETGFLDRFAKLLTAADHRRRLDRILVDRVRFKAERSQRAAIARRVIGLLPADERKAAEARLAVFLRDPGAAKLIAALPAKVGGTTDWGITFSKVAQHLAANQLDAAAAILTKLPESEAELVSPDDWWEARREAAFDAFTAKRHDLAYDLVKTSGPLSVNPLKEQLHMAGWIALRKLDKPKLALGHFEAAIKVADGPLSRARSAYWAGRTLEALGRKDDAKARYGAAIKDPDTFHALLSRQKLAGAKRTKLAISVPELASSQVAQRFMASDLVRAAVLAKRANLDRNIAIGLFAGLRNSLQSEAELALLAELADALGDPQTSLRVGKTAIARGFNLLVYAYPLDKFPIYQPIRTPPEAALLLSVARQETEFNHTIVSHAGARGLLQVMPVTAKHVCQQHRVKCDIPRLLTDTTYNAQIASAYIADRMSELGGWYTVSLAAYNAGPGRARQWIRENGDPRTGSIDPIDWIEQIPIEETRHYVEKVLSNIQIYRARLGEAEPLRLEEDLAAATGIKVAGQR